MANPVTDPLAGASDLNPWQPDADGSDTNAPQDSDRVSTQSSTSIAGEFRRIKSETRKLSLNLPWINYEGCEDTAFCPDAAGPVFASDVSFTLVGDWITAGIAQVGRRVRVTTGSLGAQTSTIKTVTYSGGITTFVLTDDICGSNDDDLQRVEFGLAVTDSPVHLVPSKVTIGNEDYFVLPVELGGTGTINGALNASNVPMGGDVGGTAAAAIVTGIRENAIGAGSAARWSVLGSLVAGAAGFVGINQLMTLADPTTDAESYASLIITNPPRDNSKGYVRIPMAKNGDATPRSFYLAWFEAELDPVTSVPAGTATVLTINWSDLPNGFVWSTAEDAGVDLDSPLACWVAAQYIAHEDEPASPQTLWPIVGLKSYTRNQATAYILNTSGGALTGNQLPRVLFFAIGVADSAQ